MTVLIILGLIILILVTYLIAKEINKYTNDIYGYKFFEWRSYLIVSFSYILISSGIYFYNKAINSNGDLLNGQILIALGVIGLIWTLVDNIRHTKIHIAILGTILQLLIYSVLVFIGIFTFFMVLSYELRCCSYYDNR